MCLNHTTRLFLFDCYISCVINYASEIWETQKGQILENLHLDFCKKLLCVKRTTCSSAVYIQLGRYPLSTYRMYNTIKYWKYVLYSDNCMIVVKYLVINTGYILLRNVYQNLIFVKLG